jgi:hypothetical protein
MQEMVSCSVAVSDSPILLKNVSPQKQSAYERKPNRFHLAPPAKPSYAKPASATPART